jgi:hypothetical protein
VKVELNATTKSLREKMIGVLGVRQQGQDGCGLRSRSYYFCLVEYNTISNNESLAMGSPDYSHVLLSIQTRQPEKENQ